jgi:integrase
MRPRFTGSIFQRGATYWIQFYDGAGQRQRESTRGTSKKKAEKNLQGRLGQVENGTYAGAQVGRVRVGELAESLLAQYRSGEIKGLKSLEWSERRWNIHLAPFFENAKAGGVSTDLLRSYIARRQKQGAQNATINRELSFLRRAFNVARKSSPPKVQTIPAFPHLEEPKARQGFLSDEQYGKLASGCAAAGLWLRAMLAVGCNFAWRKSELLKLRVTQVDLLSRVIRLEPGTTKNSDGRTVVMTNETFELLGACTAGKKPDDYVFTREDGKPVKSFRGAWAKVCADAGVPALLFHDLRRTGARNLRRLGVSEGVIMRIAGWKTRNVFERYNIVDQADLADAARRLDEKSENQEIGHSTATVAREQKREKGVENVQ